MLPYPALLCYDVSYVEYLFYLQRQFLQKVSLGLVESQFKTYGKLTQSSRRAQLR